MDNNDLNNLTVDEVLKRIDDGGKESIALLKMIEDNTSRMKTATTALQKQAVVSSKVQAKRSAAELKATNRTGKVIVDAVAKDLRERDRGGRFVSRQAGRTLPAYRTVNEASDTPVHESKGTTLFDILRRGAANQWNQKGGSVKDIAGRAALGPLWDIGGELKEAVQAMKEKSSQGTAAEIKAWGKVKFGMSKDGKVRIQQAIPTPKPDKKKTFAEKAQRAVEARQQVRGVASTEGGKSVVGDAVGTAAGNMLGRVLSPLGRAIGPVVAGLTAFAGPIAAVLGVGALAYAVGTKLNGLINKLGLGIDTTPKKSSPIDHGKPMGLLSSQFEGDVGSVTKDNMGWAYGKWQMNSEKGILRGFLQDSKNPYAKELRKAGPVDSPEFQAKWKAIAQRDPKGFEEAQREFVTRTNYDPTAKRAGELGFRLDSNAVNEAVFSGAVQHGGVNKILEMAANSTPDFAALSTDQQLEAFYNAREQYVRDNMPSRAAEQIIKERYTRERRKALAMSYMEQGMPNFQAVERAGIEKRPANQMTASEQSTVDSIISAPVIDTKGKDVYKPVSTIQATPQYRRAPEPKPIHREASVETQEISKTLTALQKNLESQQQNQPKSRNERDKERVALIPHIQTEFSDTQLVLMAYDRV